MTVRKATKQQAEVYKQRQAYMKALGYTVPQDGSWGPWQQAQWERVITRHKTYEPNIQGFLSGVADKVMGTDTEKVDPLDRGTARKWSPDNVDWGKTRRSQNKAMDVISGSVLPATAIVGLPWLAGTAYAAPIATAVATAGGAAGGYAVNKASEAVTGRDLGTNVAMHTLLTPELAELLNPGYTIGGVYGNFVGNNLANRGRYTLNYLTPASYKGHAKEVVNLIFKPFYEAPPTFYNGRKPAWYAEYANTYGLPATENRFQNGAVWAGVPEKEVPRTMYARNADGSYRMTPKGTADGRSFLDMLPDDTEIFPDVFTVGRVGGEHSQYTKLGNVGEKTIMQFEDRQKLNPQWQLADRIKDRFDINEKSKLGRTVDFFGNIPLDKILGYKPFTIKQNYVHAHTQQGDRVRPLFMDPQDIFNPNSLFPTP